MILDSFFLLFKTDASQAKADIDTLDKQIGSLAAKGKTRSDQESTQLKALRKQRLEMTQDLRDQTKQVDKLGDSYVKLIEGAVGAITAYASFGALKAGLADSNKLNSSLAIQAQVTGQNAQELKVWAGIVEEAGGSQEGFLQSMRALAQTAAEAGLPFTKVNDLLRTYHNLIKGLPKKDQLQLLSRAGITDDATISILQKTDEEFNKVIADSEKRNKVTEEDIRLSRETTAAWSDTGQSFGSVFTKINTQLAPAILWLNGELQSLAGWMTEHPDIAGPLTASFAIMGTALSALLSGVLARAALAFVGLGKAAVTAGAGAGEGAAAVGAGAGIGIVGAANLAIIGGAAAKADLEGARGFGTAVSTLWNAHKLSGQTGGRKGLKYNRETGKWEEPATKRSESVIGPQSSDKQIYDFWIAQGYSPAQAAGLAGNAKGEGWNNGTGGPNHNGIGDGGTAFGIAQWHADRVKKILDGTGIDVRTASQAEQLKAQAWEMKTMGISPDTLPNSTAGSADYLVRHYEFPANKTLDSMKRAGYAAEIANQHLNDAAQAPASIASGGGNKTTTVQTGAITITTQATDAKGIGEAISTALKNEIRYAFSTLDDGRTS